MLSRLKQFVPKPIVRHIVPWYHFVLAYLGSVYYRHPSREITVIGITGTKGKSSVAEMVGSILREAGYTVASVSTIAFRIGDTEEPNKLKMTMPGRFFLQRFMRRAVSAGCTHVIIEMTSEGARLHRHRFIEMDALFFTNLTPEHIESHGSFAAYKAAKLSLVTQLEQSQKSPQYLIVNSDDPHGTDFLAGDVETKLPYQLSDLTLYTEHKDGISLVFEDHTIRAPFVGRFNVYNLLAAITYARAIGVEWNTIERAMRNHPPIRGRAERFSTGPNAAKPLTVVVDYAHTPDSLEAIYQAFPDQTKICVLGNTGGGRDTWKRPEMAGIAEQHCEHIILTNEDPYDEDPEQILAEMRAGITDQTRVTTILDRRAAIAHAIDIAPAHGYILVTGKGTDPFIMGAHGSKEPWSDAEVVQELLAAPHDNATS